MFEVVLFARCIGWTTFATWMFHFLRSALSPVRGSNRQPFWRHISFFSLSVYNISTTIELFDIKYKVCRKVEEEALRTLLCVRILNLSDASQTPQPAREQVRMHCIFPFLNVGGRKTKLLCSLVGASLRR